MKMYNSTHLFMVPSTSRRIRNYEQVKFTATMNKAIDILRLQIEGKCPSVKLKHNNYDTCALSWIVPSASLASAIEEIKMKTSLSPLLCLIISPGFRLRYENVSLWLWTSRKCAILSIKPWFLQLMNIQAQISATAHSLYWKWRRISSLNVYKKKQRSVCCCSSEKCTIHWWWWVVVGGVWSDLVDICRVPMGVGLPGAGSLIYMLRISDWWCMYMEPHHHLLITNIYMSNQHHYWSIRKQSKSTRKYCYVSVWFFSKSNY